MSDAHGGLGTQDQVADTQVGRAPHQVEQQPSADALALGLWPDGKRTDLCLFGTRDDLASMGPGLEHDRSDDSLGLAVPGVRTAMRLASGHSSDEDLSVAVSAEPAQRGYVPRVCRDESVADIGRNPDVADLRHLGWQRGPNAHHTPKLCQPDEGRSRRAVWTTHGSRGEVMTVTLIRPRGLDSAAGRPVMGWPSI